MAHPSGTREDYRLTLVNIDSDSVHSPVRNSQIAHAAMASVRPDNAELCGPLERPLAAN
ncbi:Hypothetical predicted protein [Olea europaea subsp. europaea]|uniref:Uncharacterized protein n=1 Tax=Olea europaea subsp. europaea TaxID=158383 RepID=A0A8S0RDR2_OLEEU|nr:Hypothetical predicted protein [Olea europaea subsp. europaea]